MKAHRLIKRGSPMPRKGKETATRIVIHPEPLGPAGIAFEGEGNGDAASFPIARRLPSVTPAAGSNSADISLPTVGSAVVDPPGGSQSCAASRGQQLVACPLPSPRVCRSRCPMRPFSFPDGWGSVVRLLQRDSSSRVHHDAVRAEGLRTSVRGLNRWLVENRPCAAQGHTSPIPCPCPPSNGLLQLGRTILARHRSPTSGSTRPDNRDTRRRNHKVADPSVSTPDLHSHLDRQVTTCLSYFHVRPV